MQKEPEVLHFLAISFHSIHKNRERAKLYMKYKCWQREKGSQSANICVYILPNSQHNSFSPLSAPADL